MSAMREDLLRAILDDPEALEPRLVMADWLMERGDPRGDFISSQCALLGSLSRRRRVELKAHVAELLADRGSEWAAAAALVGARDLQPRDREDNDNKPWRFRGGFIDYLVADCKALIEHGESLWQADPVPRLKVQGATGKAMAALAEAPFLARVRYLTIRGRIGDRGAAALAKSPHLGNLRRLNLLDTGIGDKGAISLAGAETLSPTDMLCLTGNDIGDEGVVALAGSAILAGLHRLYLARNPIADAGARALADSPHVGGLEELGLGGIEDLSDDGALALVDSTQLVALRRIELSFDLSGATMKKVKQRFADARFC